MRKWTNLLVEIENFAKLASCKSFGSFWFKLKFPIKLEYAFLQEIKL